MGGPLALVGGAEWREGCTFDRGLLEASGAEEVLVLPTAAAYEHPERAVATARKWFEQLGGGARGPMVLGRGGRGPGGRVRRRRRVRPRGAAWLGLGYDSATVTEVIFTVSEGRPFAAPGTPSFAMASTVARPSVT